MALSEQRQNELAMARLLLHYRENGVTLHPSEVKRSIHNMAKKLGVSPQEVAESSKIIYKMMYEETIEVVDSIICDVTSKVEG